jgi:undecaprenyl-diphosphatase
MDEGLKNIIKQVSFKLLFAVATFIVALYGFAAFMHEIFFEKEDELDQRALNSLSKGVPSEVYNIMYFFSFFGKPAFLIPAYAMLIGYFFIKHKKRYGVQVLILALSSTALLFGIKYIFRRSRPQIPIFKHLPGYSFPSGHALLGFVFFSILIYMVWQGKILRPWKWILSLLLLLFSLLVGISRIILKVHYASDVIAGFCLGYAWVLFFLWIHNNKERQWRKLND